MTAASIGASSVLCAGGFGASQVWATMRSRMSRTAASTVTDRFFEPIVMGFVPEKALDPEEADSDLHDWPARAQRMLRLAAPPLRELSVPAALSPVALYLGLPRLETTDAPWADEFAATLCTRAGLKLDKSASRAFPVGRAAALLALESALDTLAGNPSCPVIVGGVDTFLDPLLLATLEAEGRLFGPRVMDGFVPGEGAAFLLLQNVASCGPRAVQIEGAASTSDPGHRYGTEPARGEGLSQALQLLRQRVDSPAMIGSTFSALNGENFDAKLWGVAQLRHRDLFDPDMTLEHPASCFGDTGAAAGAILTVLAATALAARHRRGPALVWAASDHAERGCAVLSVSSQTSGH